MVPSIFSAFTGSITASGPVKNIANEGSGKPMAKSLPAIVYRDQEWYELERRGIFSKSWILATHSSRFSKPGDFVSQTYAGFAYFIIKNKDGGFHAHHNVCRHRAFPVLNKDDGNASIIACKYHSWSYRYDGSLIKAPQFEKEPDFKKEENGLFPIHVHVTDKGFVFVNFSADEPVPFEEHFGSLPREWAKLPVEEYQYCPEASWTVTGKYNWKTLMDGYQECYHCTVGHPGFAKSLDLKEYKVIPFTNFARHQVPNADPSEANPPSFTFVFPNTGVTTCPQMWYMMRCVPVDAHTTRMEYDVYRHKLMSVDALKEFMLFYEQVEKEDFDLCEATQRGLEAGIYSKGILHPGNENGVLYYQQLVLQAARRHQDSEVASGHEIYPAMPVSQRSEVGCTALSICSALSSKALAW